MAKKIIAGLIEKVGQAPPHLSEHAKTEYKRIMKILVEEKIATTLDLSVIEGACIQYGIYREMYDAVTDNGEKTVADYIRERGGNSQMQGELNAMNKAFEHYTKVMRMFGATPAARRTMKIQDKEKRKEEEEKDPLEKDLDL